MNINIKNLSIEELLELNSEVVSLIKTKRSHASKNAKRGLFSGTKVSFDDGRGGRHSGTVIKTMRKFAKIRVGSDVWRVPMHALTKE